MGVCCLLFLLPFAAYADDVMESTDVIVIGAGASGIAAARELTNQGVYDVTVLEARTNRYGGRIWTNTEAFSNVSSGPEFEMGAAYIHHPDQENLVVQLHREFGLPMLDLDFQSSLIVRQKDGVAYDWDRVYTSAVKVEEVFETASNYSVSMGQEMSIRAAMWKTKTASSINNPLSQVAVAAKEFEFASTIEDISASQYNVGYENASDTMEKITSAGYIKLLDKLVQRNASDTPLNIRLGQEVTQVEILSNHRVSVICRDGTKYEARAVIVTLPLGVLKAKAVKFIPELSEKKQAAIHRIGFGTVNKVVLEFDRMFWPKKTFINLAVKNITQRGELCLFTTFQSTTSRPILVGYAVSYFGTESEKLSDNKLKILALKRLRTIFGSVMDTVTVVKMARTRWLADPFSRGSYSFPAVGVRPNDWDVIGEPDPPLFFAGEHTRTYMYGTVQNAIATGWRATQEVTYYLDNTANSASSISLSHISAVISIFVFLHIIVKHV